MSVDWLGPEQTSRLHYVAWYASTEQRHVRQVIAPPSLGNPHTAYQCQGRVTDPPQLIDQRPDVDGRLSSTHTPHGSALPSDCPWLLRPASPRQETGIDKL